MQTERNAEPVALVTGASKGLGLAVAQKLSQRGYFVILNARHAKDLEKARKAMSHAKRAAILAADVASPRFAAALGRCLKRAGQERLDLVVHAAAINHMGTIAESRLENAEATMRTNALSVMQLAQAARSFLEAGTHPRFVLVSSLMQYFAMPGRSVYAASKVAAEYFAQAWGSELRCEGSRIRVQIFRPAGIETGFHGNTRTDGSAPRSDISRMSAEAAAEHLVRLVKSGASASAPGWMNKVVAFVARHFPRLTRYLAERRYRRSIEPVFPG